MVLDASSIVAEYFAKTESLPKIVEAGKSLLCSPFGVLISVNVALCSNGRNRDVA